jgi:hypothetical protein
MTKVEALEREIEKLTPDELSAFRDWFSEYDWQVWDRQLEQDVAEGKLDELAAEALAEFQRGETRAGSTHPTAFSGSGSDLTKSTCG